MGGTPHRPHLHYTCRTSYTCPHDDLALRGRVTLREAWKITLKSSSKKEEKRVHTRREFTEITLAAFSSGLRDETRAPGQAWDLSACNTSVRRARAARKHAPLRIIVIYCLTSKVQRGHNAM